MIDVYRPLFVMVEAVEAEARRLLEAKPTTTTIPTTRIPTYGEKLRYIEREIRDSHQDRSLHIQFQPLGGARIGHRCKVCGEGHTIEVSDERMAAARTIQDTVDLWLDAYDRLQEVPCELELGH